MARNELTMQCLGAALKNEREEGCQWSQKEAAGAAHIARLTILRMERGQTSMRMTTFFDICRAYGAPPEDVMQSMARVMEQRKLSLGD